ncbi:MAG TPA: RsmE family RNA methyltransferase [Candidatus Aquilonibacter sp.]|nr:RsmE family RNA methyltransferase [Candidatus Aquilonibacter sp.]
MTRRRWIADEVSGNRAILIGEHAGHLVRVLRARVGQQFDVVTPEGARRGQISSLTPDRVEFDLGEKISSRASVGITLALGIFKFDRMEWAIEKCTELGVSRIVPLIARRTDSHLASASMKRVERWERIARQASQQSRRDEPPQIAAPVKPSEIMNSEATLRIVLNETEEQATLLDVLNDDVLKNDPPCGERSTSARTDVILAIGPEGGWTEDELQSFRLAEWISASLAENILRTETAAIAATAIVGSALRAP